MWPSSSIINVDWYNPDMQKMFDLNSYPLKDNLDKLLVDKTTGKNIIFATDDYLQYDKNAGKEAEITVDFLNKYGDEAIRPRYCKSSQHQSDRTKENAEVFTPVWICNKMIDYCDDELDCGWKDYINTSFLEITCGEAPFLCSRYDSSTGEFIEVKNRTGIIDRKLNVISKNCDDSEQWFNHALDAYKSTYGYEFQGDSLLIARINMLMSFIEHMESKFDTKPSNEQINEILKVICWNIFQMDGLKNTIPFKEAKQGNIQTTLFDLDSASDEESVNTLIYDWKNDTSIEFFKLKKGNAMKFDFCIGNPPYQEETDNNNRQKPVYHYFYENARIISTVTELITPARFLFNAGQTPKAWNLNMLNSNHFKVLEYFEDASFIFPNTEIKGGVAITYYSNNNSYEPIKVFTSHDKLGEILDKVFVNGMQSLKEVCVGAVPYKYTSEMISEKPEWVEFLGDSYDLRTNCFSKLYDKAFIENPQNDSNFVKVYGQLNNRRKSLWIKGKYLEGPSNFLNYKVLLPKATGSGKFGEIFPEMIIAKPKEAHTQSYVSIGLCKNKTQASNIVSYIKTKFCRALIGILKSTQDITPSKFSYVPLQDFTNKSDIDWSKSIPEIDQQLYKKYKLSKDEIDFIEAHVKEMK